MDDTFNLILLDELIGNSVVLAISLYYVIMVCYIIKCYYYISRSLVYTFSFMGLYSNEKNDRISRFLLLNNCTIGQGWYPAIQCPLL